MDSYIDMMFNQILPDFMEGLVVVTNESKLTHHLNVSLTLNSFIANNY